ncbi:MAG: hypothetical protein K2X99_05135 [Gemmatimonadaceae bacterium]|nr:hypothetical protein [Gemmatimonadaceae bacterium]
MASSFDIAMTRDQLVKAIDKPVSPRLKQIALAAALAGGALFFYGVLIAKNGRAWHALHVNWLFWTIIASAAGMFSAAQRITTARWSRSVIRMLEGFVAFLPLAFIILLGMVLFGKQHLYPWWNLVGTGELAHEKEIWFAHSFFQWRSVITFGLIAALQLWYVWTAVRLDVGVTPEAGAAWAAGIRAKMRAGFGEERRELHSTHSQQGMMAVFMALIFGFGWTMLAWDHSMSLDWHFFSTMYGWQVFMGGWLVALMFWSGLVRWWKVQLDDQSLITDKQLHDIGKLCFAFTAFWGYLTFSQYLVIWYANMAEETHFFTLRLTGIWKPTTMAVVWLAFALPFFGLLSVKAKMWTPTMMFFAACSTVGIWFARYTEIYPSYHLDRLSNLPLGIWEAGITIGFAGAFAYCYLQFMDAFPKMRVLLMTSPYRDEVQVPVDPKTMEPLPAHE